MIKTTPRQPQDIFWIHRDSPRPGSHSLSRFTEYGYHIFHRFEFFREGHERDDALLLVTLRGSPVIHHEESVIKGRRGSVTFFFPGEDHQYKADLWEAFFFHFHPSPNLLRILEHYGIARGFTLDGELSEVELERLSSVFAFPSLPLELQQHRCGVLMERLILGCLKEKDHEIRPPEQTPLESIAQYVESNPGAGHSVSSLARQVNLSPSRFAHRFKERFGLSVHAFITRARMERAKHLLQASGMTASQIASELGYQTPYHFYAAFRKHTGRTALQWRRNRR